MRQKAKVRDQIQYPSTRERKTIYKKKKKHDKSMFLWIIVQILKEKTATVWGLLYNQNGYSPLMFTVNHKMRFVNRGKLRFSSCFSKTKS